MGPFLICTATGLCTLDNMEDSLIVRREWERVRMGTGVNGLFQYIPLLF